MQFMNSLRLDQQAEIETDTPIVVKDTSPGKSEVFDPKEMENLNNFLDSLARNDSTNSTILGVNGIAYDIKHKKFETDLNTLN